MIIYHNARCSKSRATLALLLNHGFQPEIVNYLENPPDPNTLRSIINMLGGTIRDIIRSSEPIYRELSLDNQSLSESTLIDIVATNPRLLQRPIVVNGDQAAVGRPPENVLEIL